MSHELTVRDDNFVEMAYVGDMPWHGLGQELQQGADIAQWSKAAGMDWLIKRSRVRYGTDSIFDEHHVLFRSDNKAPLSIVGEKYKIVQPIEMLEFFRDLAEDNAFTLETAGTLFSGKRFWALARIGESAVIQDNDKIDGFLLLTSSCDGTLATTAKFITTRVVCNNTLSMAMSEKTNKPITVSHRTTFDATMTKQRLGIAQGAFADFIKVSRELSYQPVSYLEATAFVGNLLLDTGTVKKDDVVTSKAFLSIMELFKHGKGNHGETKWDLINGVTEFVDHVQRAKTESHRFANALLGKGDDLKTMALERIIAM